MPAQDATTPVNRPRPTACWRSNLRTVLDPHETNAPDPATSDQYAPPAASPTPDTLEQPAPTSDRGFRHSGWFHQRARVYAALTQTIGDGGRRDRFRNCGANAWVMRTDQEPPRYRVSADYCHDRWCLPCSVNRSRLIAANLRPRIADEAHRFITLTLRSANEPLAPLLRKLYRCFAQLRRTELWTSTITGGVAFCELTFNRDRQSWHPHLHVIASGKFIPQKLLSQAWLKITRDSFIVDVSLIRGHDKCVDYITKYASKPLSPTFSHDHDRLCEAILSLRGKRLALTFGSWRGVPLTAVRDDAVWVAVEPLASLRDKAQRGDAAAQRILCACLGETAWTLIGPENPDLWDQ